MKIAVIGTGVAGNVIAHHLQHQHDVHVFEAGSHIGGHAHTHDIELGGRYWSIDTGFIVYNELTYPHFTAMLKSLGVATQPSHMSFSVRCDRTGLEYNGNTLNSLFAHLGAINTWPPVLSATTPSAMFMVLAWLMLFRATRV